MRRWPAVGLLALAMTSGVVSSPSHQETTPQVFFSSIDPVVDALWNTYDERAAFGHVQFISQDLAAARQCGL